jgi:WD40 repeat protein
MLQPFVLMSASESTNHASPFSVMNDESANIYRILNIYDLVSGILFIHEGSSKCLRRRSGWLYAGWLRKRSSCFLSRPMWYKLLLRFFFGDADECDAPSQNGSLAFPWHSPILPAFSPDGSQIVSILKDTTVRFWDAISGDEVIPPLRGHNYLVRSTAFSPDGEQVVSESQDVTVPAWSVDSGVEAIPPVTDYVVRSIASSSDGTRILSGSRVSGIGVDNVWDRSDLRCYPCCLRNI